jgi:hypothetical protein
MTGFLAELGTKLADRWLAILILPGALLIAAAGTAGTLGQVHALDISLLKARITAVAGAPGAHSPGVLLLAIGGIMAASALAGLAASALGSATARLWVAVGPPPVARPGTKRVTSWIRQCHPMHWLTALRVRCWRDRDDRWRQAQAAAVPLRQQTALISAGIGATASPLQQQPSGGTAGASPQPMTVPAPEQVLAASRAATRVADAALAHRNRIATGIPTGPTWIGERLHAVDKHI